MQENDSTPKASQSPKRDKPDLPDWLFWEYDLERMNWRIEYVGIIQRVLERGTIEEWEIMIAYYGRQKVVDSLLYEIRFLPNYLMEDVSNYFGLKKEDMKCYITKPSRPGHWI